MTKNFRYLPLLLLLLLTPLLMADTGPKPSATFELEYAIEPIPDLTDYVLYECEDAACQESYILEQLGPQHFDCTQYECTSMAYGYGDYLQMALTFSDGVTRTSNIFTKQHFNAEFTVTVQTDDLLVEETGGSANPFVTFLIVAIAVVCLVGILVIVGIVLLVKAIRKKRRAAEASPEG
ncbi:hypothetical protein KQH61_04615 [bacterium]|nr:hypothetical protein [bacterium]MCB2179187.1 hypothetical protein [bacterium]